MIASLLSMFQTIISSIVSIIITWVICRLWYKSSYVHRDEVVPLQQSQHMMQNQYSILAERIKLTDIQLAETKAKLIEATEAQNEALLQLAKFDSSITISAKTLPPNELDQFTAHIINELKNTFGKSNLEKTSGSPDEGLERGKIKEQFSLVRQGLMDLKSDVSQKFYTSSNQYNELLVHLKELIEVNKKLYNEAEILNNSIHISGAEEPSDRQFKLTSIKKRS